MEFSFWRAVAIATLIIGSITHASASDRSLLTRDVSQCQAIELTVGPPEYNQLVCDGISYMDAGSYPEAIKAFESAMKIRLHEIPNVALFSRLALAHQKNGDRQKARENIEKARLSLSVLVGILHCVETEKGVTLSEAGKTTVATSYANDVALKMCGAAYESLYEQKSLEAIVSDAEFIRFYFDIKKLIK